MKKPEVLKVDLGSTNYVEALRKQEDLMDDVLEVKLHNRKAAEPNRVNQIHYLLYCQHESVYTLGKRGKMENLKVEPSVVGADFYHTNRGGDITYHGPGQLIVYPIFDLEAFGLSLKGYIEKLEETVIHFLKKYGLKGERLQGASGVWLDADKPSARKICAVGVKASRYVTMHGLALNINTDLSFFKHIVPCGIDDKAVTSLRKEMGEMIDFEKAQLQFLNSFRQVFGVEYLN
jgi:lipoyl(octanoyl) transferase